MAALCHAWPVETSFPTTDKNTKRPGALGQATVAVDDRTVRLTLTAEAADAERLFTNPA